MALSKSTDAVTVGLILPAHGGARLPEDFKSCKRYRSRLGMARAGGHGIDMTENRCREED